MKVTEMENWINAAPPQLSRSFLRNMATSFAYDPPPGLRALVQVMAKTTSDEAEGIGLLSLHQMAALSSSLRRIANDVNRPEKPVDSRAHFEAWQHWMAQAPDWLQKILTSTAREIVEENKLTPKQLLEALWLSQGRG